MNTARLQEDLREVKRPVVGLTIYLLRLLDTITSLHFDPLCRADDWAGKYVVGVGSILHGTTSKYLIVEKVGEGSFGVVARGLGLEQGSRSVAIKVLRNHALYPAVRQLGRLERNFCIALNRLQQRSDVQPVQHRFAQLYESFIVRDHLCLVFEFLPQSLYDVLLKSKFNGVSAKLCARLVGGAIEGLAQMHAAGVAHCDVKPENIMLRNIHNCDSAVLIDFGSCVVFDQHVPNHSLALPSQLVSSQSYGNSSTPSSTHFSQALHQYIQSRYYRAPEVILHLPLSTSIDIWSIGCVLFEIATGRVLFEGSSSMNQLVRMESLLGPIPIAMIRSSPRGTEYSQYRLIHGHSSSSESIAMGLFGESGRIEVSVESKQVAFKETFIMHVRSEVRESGVRRRSAGSNAKSPLATADETDGLLLGALLWNILQFEPHKRMTMEQIRCHPFFEVRQRRRPREPTTQPNVTT